MHSTQILYGKPVADAILESVKPDVQRLNPKLVVVQVGDDPASSSYIKQKLQSCEKVGMRHEHRHLDATVTREELFATIDALNHDDDVTGFIVQLPLPSHLQSCVNEVIEAIDPRKDVDGFGTTNIGNVFLGVEREYLPPATPSGVVSLLEFYNIDVEGKHVVIVGRSNIVGKPLAVMLLNRGATVTVCHSKTKNLAEITRQADILCAAVGKAKMITTSMVKEGAVIIDIGVSRVDGKLYGDADFDNLQCHVSSVTPVPGGVGPLTVASLIRNCVKAAKARMYA